MASCGGGGATVRSTTTVSTAPPPPSTAPVTTFADPAIPASLGGFGIETVFVGDDEWLVAVADSPDERNQGLRRVDGLGDLDGMIFVYDEPDVRVFTMSTVPIPLEIGFFDEEGVLAEVLRMEPCAASESECPTYSPSRPFRWAIETEVGRWAEVAPGSVLAP